YLALRPNDVNKRLQLGYVLSRGKKEFGKAIGQFNEVIRRDPENRSDRLGPAYNHLGLAYLYSGRFDSAMIAFKKYQAHAPNNPDPLHSLANALSFHGDYEAAVRQFRQVIQEYPHYYLNFAPKLFFESTFYSLTNPHGRTSAPRSFE
ncbi:MAG: tetratricopeptide repeat protein, partial [bacterium]